MTLTPQSAHAQAQAQPQAESRSLDHHGSLMDGVYRYTRHVYDLSRKYYLFGRDRMIGALDLKPGETVLEIGCGTGRNLVQTARRYPGTQLFGVDASTEMLKTAEANAQKARVPVTLVHGFAETVTVADMHGAPEQGFDVVMFSYALSMIPDWQGAIANAGALLARGGRFHAVDFGQMEQWPVLVRSPFNAFLDAFHVAPRPGVAEAMATAALEEITEQPIAGGYAMLYSATKPG
ncbi:MAG: class I SAM-dependent methyltransferase [Pseudomonadota bacterium]